MYSIRVALVLTILLLGILLATGCTGKESFHQRTKKEITSEIRINKMSSDGTQHIKEHETPDVPFYKGVTSSTLLSYRFQRRILPEDPIIGPLADSIDTTEPGQDLLRITRLFLTSLIKGDMSDAPFSAYGQRYLSGTIDYHLGQGLSVTDFRIGRVEQTEPTAYLQARIFGQLGRSITADIYLILSDDNWLIDDIQTNWAMLKIAQPEPKPITLPRSDGWVYF